MFEKYPYCQFWVFKTSLAYAYLRCVFLGKGDSSGGNQGKQYNAALRNEALGSLPDGLKQNPMRRKV